MRKHAVYAIAIALLLGAGAIAQPPGPPPGGPGGPPHGPPPEDGWFERPGPDSEMRDLMRQVMMARLSKDLALDDEQTVLMVKKLTEFQDEYRAMREERGKLMRELRDALKAGRDDESIAERFKKLQDHDERMQGAKKAMFDATGKGLTDWQQARLYIFLYDFENDMRRLMMRAEQRRRFGGPEGMGPRGGPDGFGPPGEPGGWGPPEGGPGEFGRGPRGGPEGRRGMRPPGPGGPPHGGPGGPPPPPPDEDWGGWEGEVPPPPPGGPGGPPPPPQ